MRAGLATLLAVVLGAALLAPAAGAAEPGWKSAQPVAPGLGVPTTLGPIGGMAFWAPNKGVMITGVQGGLPAGVYAYDGSGWYLYSSVCGGGEGSIVISGPDEFWTVAAFGEEQEGVQRSFEQARTICHFANGEIVASYAEPAASPEEFPRMHAAACEGPADCWFAGEQEGAMVPNKDPFHLHWDGAAVTAVPSMSAIEPEVAPMAGTVDGLAFAQGRLFETANAAPYLREVSPADPRRFLSLEPPTPFAGPLMLGTEPLAEELWAGENEGEGGALLRLGPAGMETVPTGPGPLFETTGFNPGMIEAIGVEPGTGTAWVGGGAGDSELRQVSSDGTLGPIVQLPAPGEELDTKGPPEHIVCAVPGQCWMSTASGWLFHLGGPPAEGVNTDPLMHRLISVRPKDASSRTFVSAGLPPDDSGEVEPNALGEPVVHQPFQGPRKGKPLVVKVKQKVIDKTILQLSFTLRAMAHVQLLAKFHKKVVAKTARLTLGKGPHRIRLHLDPKRWPTGLSFQVHPAGKRAAK
jgi:hypothetical protein